MKKGLFVFGLILNASFMFSQDKKHKIDIDLQQLTLSDAPRYAIGYGFMLNEKWEASLALGYGNANIMPIKSLNLLYDFNESYQLFEIRPEIKYYYRTNSKTPHLISAEISYLSHKDHFSGGSFKYYNSFQEIGYRQADYHRVKIALTLNYGFDIHFDKEHRFGIMPKIGFGIHERNVQYSNLTGVVEREAPDDWVIIFPNQQEGDFIYNAGRRFGFEMLFTIKAFYKF